MVQKSSNNNQLVIEKNKIFIVAEIGNNHEGNFLTAKKLIVEAAKAKVDAVKFQTFNTELFIDSSEKKRRKILSKFKFNKDEFIKLSELATKLGLIFFSTPFDFKSANFLNSIQPIFKIASGDNNYLELIDYVSSFNKPIIISTGLAELNLLKKLEERILKKWKNFNTNKYLAFLHCVSSYPVPESQANLNAISTLKKKFPKCKVGYSDHLLGVEGCYVAAALGAKIIEKHFTLDKKFSKFRDHQLSADPKELKEMVIKIRRIEKILGNGRIEIQECEKDSLIHSRRSLALSKTVSKNYIIKKKDLIRVRLATGFLKKKELVGKKINKNLSIGSLIKNEFLGK